ncbi:MAG: CerR family C-terminal domain-containing protein, partial [Planctomycetales bacterium]|nr:CerR family C-terminal domain-containing protein [Planctomycetales bacterium]
MKDSDIATRDRLLAAAIREFADKGFEGATVRDICERANVNVNGVKYYFEDKNGLYIAAVAEAHRVSTRMDLHALPDPALPAEQRLRQFVSGLVAMMMGAREEGDPHHTLMLREMANPTEATEELVRGTIEPRFRVLDSLLSELLPPGTSPLQRQLFGFS